MKNKIIIFALFVVILAGSISIIAAEEATFGNNSFEIPEGFDVTESNDTAISLKNDDDYQIFIMTGELLDLKTAKANREALGLKFLGEENYTDEDIDVEINQQNYVDESVQNNCYYYTFTVDDSSYIIGYSFPVSDEPLEGSDNPITTIINTLE